MSNFVLFVLSFLFCFGVLTLMVSGIYNFLFDPAGKFVYGQLAEVKFAKAETIKEVPMKLWILQTINDAGLDINKVECLINHEGGFNDNAFHINTNNTIDVGVYEFNSVHLKNISLKCMADYKCATKEFIKMVKKNGNLNAWNGYKSNCK